MYQIWARRIGEPYPEFSLIFPGHFRSEKNREKLREIRINRGNRDKLREIGGNWGQSRLFPTYLELFKRSGWPSRLIPKCRDKSGRLKNPDLDFGSRSGRPPRSSSPISVTYLMKTIPPFRHTGVKQNGALFAKSI